MIANYSKRTIASWEQFALLSMQTSSRENLKDYTFSLEEVFPHFIVDV